MNIDNLGEVYAKFQDAFAYLMHMKVRYRQRPQTFNDFLDIMGDFKSNRIDDQGAIDRVAYLFRRDPDMIMGFNMFLPPKYMVVVVNRSNNLVRKIKESMTPSSGNLIDSIYFYRRVALQKARKVHEKITLIKLKKFHRWHSFWLRNNTSENDPTNCER
ncbi:unnamed protein product [Orchesella dallaii]|uniref:Uncharacterized protein n=1 Tax=Orchesella dallaii TaxID=48710 RepID=A0ABP1R7Y4_9HEXA